MAEAGRMAMSLSPIQPNAKSEKSANLIREVNEILGF